ncbi:hypothetical protein Tco_1439655 [Tanacetum coccineum]
MTVSKRSRWGDLSGLYKSTSFTTPIPDKKSKFHPSYESLSSASSSKNFTKSIGSKKQSQKVESDKLSFLATTITDQNIRPTSDFQSLSLASCRNSVEGLRMPSPKIGFFDEVEQKRQKDEFGVLHVIDTKKKQDESDQHDSQKENVYSYKDEVNGLSKQLEVIDLDRDVAEVKGQRTSAKQHGQVISLPNAEHTQLCSRTPLAEKIIST